MDPSGGEHGGSAGAGKAGKPKAEHDTGAKDTNARGDGAHRAEQPGDGATREGKCASVHAPKHAESGWGKLISHDAEVPSMLVCGRSAELGKGLAWGPVAGGGSGQQSVASLEPCAEGSVKLHVKAEEYSVLLNNLALQSGTVSTVRDGDELTLRGRYTCSFVFKRLRKPCLSELAQPSEPSAATSNSEEGTRAGPAHDGVIDIDASGTPASNVAAAAAAAATDRADKRKQDFEPAQQEQNELQNGDTMHEDDTTCTGAATPTNGGNTGAQSEEVHVSQVTGKRKHQNDVEQPGGSAYENCADENNEHDGFTSSHKAQRHAERPTSRKLQARKTAEQAIRRHQNAAAAAAAAENRRSKRSAMRRERGTSTARALGSGSSRYDSIPHGDPDTNSNSGGAGAQNQVGRKRRELVLCQTQPHELGHIDLDYNFSYSYVPPAVCDVLRSTAKLHLTEHAKDTPAARAAAKVGAGSNRISLWGPPGSEKFMEAMSRALAAENSAAFVVVEHHDLMKGEEVSESRNGKSGYGNKQESHEPSSADGDDRSKSKEQDHHRVQESANNPNGNTDKSNTKSNALQGGNEHGSGEEGSYDEGANERPFISEALRKSLHAVEQSSLEDEEDDERGPLYASMDAEQLHNHGGRDRKDDYDELADSTERDLAFALDLEASNKKEQDDDGNYDDSKAAQAENGSSAKEEATFKPGDRVRFVGNCRHSPFGRLTGSEERAKLSRSVFNVDPPLGEDFDETKERDNGNKLPQFGAKGTVVMSFEENKQYVGVAFDKTFPGAHNLGGECEQSHGMLIESCQLRKDRGASAKTHGREEANIDQIFSAVNGCAERNLPVIVHVRQADKAITGCSERAVRFQACLTKCNARALFIAATTLGSTKGDTNNESKSGMARGLMMPGNSPNLVDIGMFDSMRGEERTRDTMRINKLCKIFPNRLNVHPPKEGKQSRDWQKDMEADAATERQENNRRLLQRALSKCGAECPRVSEINADGDELTEEWAERVVANAIAMGGLKDVQQGESNALKDDGKAKQEYGEERRKLDLPPGDEEMKGQPHELPSNECISDTKEASAQDNATALDRNTDKCAAAAAAAAAAMREMSKEALEHGLQQVRKQQREGQSMKLDESKAENEFEKRLLSEVVPPSEVGIRMDDVGALDNVKKTLEEVVMLPMQRPELFHRGALAKQTKGLLLFGPPGTGKTMLAKAVATESGANFLHVPLSAIASKWFGEGEKSVRAVFSLAQKISPSVVFVDEVDSLLGKREKTGEHEAMRKMKNEFMSAWDGLRSSDNDRVLVMAATNRPFDLDEAVIRRLPRRVMVDLPDKEARKQILKALLAKEVLAEDFNYETVAEKTSDFSGSDLKNLCVAAAFRPVRDHLKLSEQESASKELRPIDTQDLLAARSEVGPSLSNDSTSSMSELKQFNEQFGEGGSRSTTQLSYFL